MICKLGSLSCDHSSNLQHTALRGMATRQGSIKCSSKVKTFRSSIKGMGLLFCGHSFHNPWACESEWQPRYLQRCEPGIVKNNQKRNNQHKHAAVEPDHSPPDNIWLTFPAFFFFFFFFLFFFFKFPRWTVKVISQIHRGGRASVAFCLARQSARQLRHRAGSMSGPRDTPTQAACGTDATTPAGSGRLRHGVGRRRRAVRTGGGHARCVRTLACWCLYHNTAADYRS